MHRIAGNIGANMKMDASQLHLKIITCHNKF